MNILLAEDHHLISGTIVELVSTIFPESYILKTSNVEEGKKKIEEIEFDLIISDLDFDGEKRFDLIEFAYNHKIPTIVYSGHCNEYFVEKAKKLHVKAYVCKLSPPDELKYALLNYKDLFFYKCSTIEKKLKCNSGIAYNKPILEGGEEKVLKALLKGITRSEIANSLKISKKTLYNLICEMTHKNDCTLEQLILRYASWHSNL